MVDETSVNDELLVHRPADGVLQLTLNRAAKRNALSESLLARLEKELHDISHDRETRVVILAANGPVFSSGHDLKEMVDRDGAAYEALFARCTRVMQGLRKLPQPVIARIQGLATAAGCQLVAACDLAVAAREALFATPGVKIGLFCTTPMVPLVRAVPAKVAMEMLLTGEPLTAERAFQVGLVNRVVSLDELEATTLELAQKIAASSSITLRLGKQAFYAQLAQTEDAAYQAAVSVMTQNAVCKDAQEGIQAFLQKRPARWVGE